MVARETLPRIDAGVAISGLADFTINRTHGTSCLDIRSTLSSDNSVLFICKLSLDTLKIVVEVLHKLGSVEHLPR